jgi:hypothetical protein
MTPAQVGWPKELTACNFVCNPSFIKFFGMGVSRSGQLFTTKHIDNPGGANPALHRHQSVSVTCPILLADSKGGSHEIEGPFGVLRNYC